MNILINGEPARVEAASLEAALLELGYEGDHLATAVNEAFVAAADRAGFDLANGDRVEVVAPMQGG